MKYYIIRFILGVMKYFFTGLLFVLFINTSSLGQHAVPPSPRPVTVTLSDGSQIQLVGRGSDHLHWTETTDGYTVVRNEVGDYEYAIRRDGKLISSGVRAVNLEDRSLQQMRQLLAIPKNLVPDDDSDSHSARFAPLGSSSADQPSAVPSSGKVRLLAVCIDYPDMAHTLSAERMRQLLNDGIDGKPSFRDYFLENSYGKLDLQVDVAGWVTADKDYQYYADENGKRRARQLVQEALQQVDASVDFSRYDNDQDGDVDGVIIIHAGPGAEEGGLRQYVWSHRWTVPGVYFDGKHIVDYTIQPETRGNYYGGEVGIGIFCHEFGHLLGLPDLYDTDGSNGWSHGIGEWGLMATGGWLGREDYPAGLSAWSKEFLGWVEPRSISGDYGTFALQPAHAHPDVIRIETGRYGEYFLLENRQKSGFDAYLNGHGLAVWHINEDKTSLYPYSNKVNGDENSKGVDLEEADGSNHLDAMTNRGDAGDLFPGILSKNSFDTYSNPSSDSYFYDEITNFESGISLENIQEAQGIISFVHKRIYSNSGEDCSLAYVAQEGTNEAEAAPQWFEFTMPGEGSLRIRSRAAGLPTHARLYLSCDTDSPLKEVVSYNDERGYQDLSVKYLSAGQKVLLQWLKLDGETTGPFSFEIIVEDEVSQSDSLALVEMYNNLDGNKWQKKQNWLQTPVSGWEGVKVENGRVVELEFSATGLSGSMPRAFYNLTKLRSLVIEENQLSGTLDERIRGFSQLKKLHIVAPQLSATFMPALTSLAQLREIHLRGIRINNALPADIGSLSQLEVLRVINTELSGAIPASLGNASKLQEIDLSANRLNGVIPPEMGRLQKLESFVANKNLLTGALPSELLQLPALNHLSLEDNLLTALPDNFFTSNMLTFANLGRNRLSGSLPATVGRTSDATLHLDLSENELSGQLKAALQNIQFSLLDLSQNNFKGALPKLKVKDFLNLANNQFSQLPAIPDVNDAKLNLNASHNQFTFDDLLPNTTYLDCDACTLLSERYSPQDTLQQDTLLIIREGDPVNFALPYDTELASNQYQWYLNGRPLSGQTGPSLNLTAFGSQQEGEYTCHVSNAGLPGLTLLVDGMRVELKPKQEQQINVAAVGPVHYESPDFELDASADSELPLTFSLVSGPVSLHDKLVKIEGSGEVVIKARQAGSADYLPVEKEIRFTIAKATQKINADQIEDKVFGDEPFILSAEASSGLPVTMTVKEGAVALNGRSLTIQGAGSVKIELSQSGNKNYQAAAPITVGFTVAKASQELSWEQLADQIYGAEPLTVHASSTAGLPVTLEVVEGPASLEEGRLHLEGAGTVLLRAMQLGNENYRAAPSLEQSIFIAKAEQQITFPEIPDQELRTEPIVLEASSDAQLAVAFRVVAGPARIESNNQLYLEDEGTVTVEAYQPGNENYLAALAIEHTFTVTKPEKQSQSISVSTAPDTILATETLLLDWSASSDLPVDVTVEGPAVLMDKELFFTASGEVSVSFAQQGNDTYAEAEPVRLNLHVVKTAQTLSFETIPDISLSEESVTLVASSSSGQEVSFRVIQGDVNLQGKQLELLGSGPVIIEAYEDGNDIYLPAKPVRVTFEVLPPELLSQTIDFAAIPDLVYSPEPLALDFSASSGLPLNIAVTGPVNLLGNSLIMQAAGTVTVKVYQRGNEQYAASDTVQLSFEILPAPQSISFEALASSENQYELRASATSGLPVSFDVISGEAIIEGNILLMQGTENVVVSASQSGDSRYQPADTVRLTLINGRVTSAEDELSAVIKAYPNPSRGVFFLQNTALKADTELTLYDSRGVLLDKWKNTPVRSRIDLSEHRMGVYQLVVRSASHVHTLRLVKQ